MKEWPEGHILFLICIKHCIHMSLVIYEINKRDLYTVTFKTITKSCTLYKFSLIYLVTMLPWFIFLFHISISGVYVCVCGVWTILLYDVIHIHLFCLLFPFILWWTFSLAYFIFFLCLFIFHSSFSCHIYCILWSNIFFQNL